MKLVAASKLRMLQIDIEKSRLFTHPFVRVNGDLPSASSLRSRIVTIASDKGLCGGINSTIVKYTRVMKKFLDDRGTVLTEIVLIGERAKIQLHKELGQNFALTFTDVGKNRITF